ncbi:tyrosine-type recombinase/integrase [Spirosoma agri]|uniref:Tyrosine-type recombinase/integrase n=1 Tax=Spirosoma agri TaxID=1987381 RepID=A0A6M0IGV6_9BACT|nr:phage integrase SAM-like domain-containing protein [Spirosoma agri]NEU67052.1 tyrosine-type recombinase/integrase [Spirosoma agri]
MGSTKKSSSTYKLARLYDAGGDLSKQWYVSYYLFSPKQQKLLRKRLNVSGNTVEARQKDAAELIKEVNSLLKAGAIIDDEPTDEPVAKPVAPLIVTPSNLFEAIDYFMAIKKVSMKPNSHKTYRSSIKLFHTYLAAHGLGRLRLHQFKPAYAFAYMDYVLTELGLSNKSHNKHLGVLETLFNFYIARQQLKANPFVAIKPLAERPGRHTAFTPEQVAKVREVCALSQNTQLWLFLNFIYYTLARPQSELRLLRVCDILQKTIRIDADNAKNNRTAHVQIPPPLEKLIEQHKLRSYPGNHYVFTLEGTPGPKPVYEKYFYNQHRQILTLLKMTDQSYDLYGWKHTGVIALYKATKDVKLIQRQCRHSSLDQTDKYLRDLGLFLYEDQFDMLESI